MDVHFPFLLAVIAPTLVFKDAKLAMMVPIFRLIPLKRLFYEKNEMLNKKTEAELRRYGKMKRIYAYPIIHKILKVLKLKDSTDGNKEFTTAQVRCGEEQTAEEQPATIPYIPYATDPLGPMKSTQPWKHAIDGIPSSISLSSLCFRS